MFEAELLAPQLHDNRFFLGDDVFAYPHGAHGNRFGGDLQLFFRAGHHERVGLLGWGGAGWRLGGPRPIHRSLGLGSAVTRTSGPV